MSSYTTASPAETEALGARLALALVAGDVVAVAGELGAGKTTFVRGACQALRVEGRVRSPTFALAHRYAAPVPVAHLDLYRLDASPGGAFDELEPYFDGTITFVEWPEHAGAWLPPLRAAVRLAHLDERHRSISIEGGDDLRL